MWITYAQQLLLEVNVPILMDVLKAVYMLETMVTFSALEYASKSVILIAKEKKLITRDKLKKIQKTLFGRKNRKRY